MKTLKKFLLIACLMLIALSNMTFAVTEVFFSDVTPSTDYYSSILYAKTNDVINGYEDGTFKPDKCVNRVEFLRMLFDMMDVDVTSYEAELFSDTYAGQWYTDYVEAGRARGTIAGDPDGRFRPDSCVNRAEAAKMAVLEFNDGEVPVAPSNPSAFYAGQYNDVYQQWYYPYLEYALSVQGMGLNHVTTDDTFLPGGEYFDPAGDMTRKEVAEMLYRMEFLSNSNLDIYPSELIISPGIVIEEPLKPATDPEFYLDCEAGDVGERRIEAVLPQTADFVVGFDGTGGSQLENWHGFFDRFNDLAVIKEFNEEFDIDSIAEELGYTDENAEIFDADWEFMVGIDYEDSVANAESIYDIDDDDMEIYLVGKFEKADEFEKVFAGVAASPYYELTCMENGEFEYWTNEAMDYYFLRTGDLFLLTNKPQARDAAVERLTNDSDGWEVQGALANEDEVTEDKLGYIFIAGDFVNLINAEFMNEFGGSSAITSYSGGVGDMYVSLTADEDVVSLNSVVEIADSTDPMIAAYTDYELSLVDKVNAEDLMMYFETPALGALFDNPDYYGLSEIMEEAYNEFGFETTGSPDLSEILASELGVEYDHLEAVLNSPLAFAMSYAGTTLPGMTLYFELDDEDLESALAVAEGLDVKVQELVDEANAELLDYTDETEVEDAVFLKRLAGTDMRQVLIKVENSPDSFQEEYAEICGEESECDYIEFYYGVTDDNIFVMSFFAPNFVENHGTATLSESSGFKDAKKSLGGVYGDSLFYVDFGPVKSYALKWITYLTTLQSGSLSAEELEIIDSVSLFLSKLDYVISSSEVESDVVRSVMSLGGK